MVEIPTGRHLVYQTSLMSALLDGIYDGDTTVATLLEHGDFGLGTFNALDGEMLILDGICYRMRVDGTVEPAAGDDLSPFAVVTEFDFGALARYVTACARLSCASGMPTNSVALAARAASDQCGPVAPSRSSIHRSAVGDA